MGDQGFMKKNNIKNKNVVIIWKIVALLAVIAAVTGLFTVSKTSKGPKNIKIAAAGSENTLTLDALKEIAKKGNDITWNDFKEYQGVEIGSGLYIVQYAISEHYYVLVGAAGPNQAPMYVRLFDADTENYIDVGQESIDDFIGSD